jgi:hypothetical protein
MKIIVPVFPEPAELRLLTDALDRGGVFFHNVLQAAARWPVVVASNRPEVLKAVAGPGVETVLLPEVEDLGGSRFLPPGTGPSLQRLAEFGVLGAEAAPAVVVLDYRNPLLDTDDIAAVLDAFSGTGPVAATKAARDSPAQVDALFERVLTDAAAAFDPAFALPDEAAQAGARLATLPFPFDWPRELIPGGVAEGEVACATVHELAPFYPAFATLAELAGGVSPRTRVLGLFYREGPGLARRLLRQKELDGLPAGTAGMSVHTGPGLADSLLVEEGDSLALYCRLARADAPLILTWTPLRRGEAEAVAPRRTVLSADEVAGLGSLPGPVGSWLGPLLTLDPGECHGLVLAAGRPTPGPEYSQTWPMPLGEELLRLDPETGERVNARTGQAIVGRQDFPELEEVEGSLTVGRVEDLVALDERLAAGQVTGHRLPSGKQCRVRSGFNLLRLRALRRLAAGGGSHE